MARQPSHETAKAFRRLRRHLNRAADSANPLSRKRSARYAASLAEHLGKIVRPDRCEACGEPRELTRHHPDHRRPLDVQWLCRACHREADARPRDGRLTA